MGFWPYPYVGAISITYDDGMKSQLETAVPLLNEFEFKATFYLNPRGTGDSVESPISWKNSLLPWIGVNNDGHEIGNHTINHPCSLNIHAEWLKNNNLIDFTLNDIETDVIEAQKRINAMFPNQKHTSFAYPCYESTIGRGLHKTSYTPIIAKHLIAARAKGELRGELANDPVFCDLHHLSSWAVERKQGEFLIGLVEKAVSQGLWGIFTFHGINEGHLPIGETDLVDLLSHLKRKKDTVWVSTVSEIASYIKNKTAVEN